MSLLTVGVMLMAIEGYDYLTQNTAQTQRTGQRREGKSAKEETSAFFVSLRCRFVLFTGVRE